MLFGVSSVSDATVAPELTGNTVTGNNRSVRIPFSSVPNAASGNDFTGNARDQVEIVGNNLSRNLTLEPGVYWLVSGRGAGVCRECSFGCSPGWCGRAARAGARTSVWRSRAR